MNSAQFTALAPLMVLTVAPIVVMLLIAVRRRHRVCLWATLGLLALTLALIVRASGKASVAITGLLLIDNFALFYMALTVLITIGVVLVGLRYMAREESQPEEYYILLLIAAGGACAMAASSHFASFYLGLEILSVAQYTLVSYVRRDRRGTEAGLKYVILAAASAAFLLFGMALVYAELGTMQFDALAHAPAEQLQNKVVLLGAAMMFAAIGFKLSIVPFHLWPADVYQGAPTPVTALIATAAKAGVFAVLVRYFAVENSHVAHSLHLFVAITAAASMLAGNALALVQQNVKRLLAYSSIAHMGYLSVAFLAGGQMANDAVAVYLAAYAAATLGAFGVIIAVAPHIHGGEGMERIEDYRGFFWAQPFLGTIFIISLLSLMGIPLTAGFLGKVYVVIAGAQDAHWIVLVILALSSVMGVVYYLRLILLVVSRPTVERLSLVPINPPLGVKSVLFLASVVTLLLGVYPAPLLAITRAINPF